MVKTGIIKGREIVANKDGSRPRQMLQVELTNSDDMQTIELFSPSGTDTNPPDESVVVVLEISPSYKVAVAIDDLITPDGVPGDFEAYSISGTDKGARLKLHSEDSKASLSNNANSLLPLMEGLIDVIKAIVTTGTDPNHTISAGSKAALESYKSDFGELLRNV